MILNRNADVLNSDPFRIDTIHDLAQPTIYDLCHLGSTKKKEGLNPVKSTRMEVLRYPSKVLNYLPKTNTAIYNNTFLLYPVSLLGSILYSFM